MSSIPFTAMSSLQIGRLVLALGILDRWRAGCGSAHPLPERTGDRSLEELLLHGKARTIAVPRCRAARALGGLQARATLLRIWKNPICRVTL